MTIQIRGRIFFPLGRPDAAYLRGLYCFDYNYYFLSKFWAFTINYVLRGLVLGFGVLPLLHV